MSNECRMYLEQAWQGCNAQTRRKPPEDWEQSGRFRILDDCANDSFPRWKRMPDIPIETLGTLVLLTMLWPRLTSFHIGLYWSDSGWRRKVWVKRDAIFVDEVQEEVGKNGEKLQNSPLWRDLDLETSNIAWLGELGWFNICVEPLTGRDELSTQPHCGPVDHYSHGRWPLPKVGNP